LEENIFLLHEALANGIWKPDPYVVSIIQDPKKRTIHAASIRDRVLYQAVYRQLYPIFDISFIHDVYSSRNFKGTHAGVKRLEQFARKVSHNHTRQAFALKCDIRRFFDSIDHDVLFRMISKRIHDEKLLDFIYAIIDSFHHTPGKGLPLGNVTSQLFANIYMDELDQFVKHRLKAKYYVRYCDDFIILDPSREVIENLIQPISLFLRERLLLEIHPRKLEIRKLRQGVDFLGYVSLPYRRVLRTSTKKRMLRKIDEAKVLFQTGAISSNKLSNIVASYLGMLSHCESQNIKNVIYGMLSTIMFAKLLNGRIARTELKKKLMAKISAFKTEKGFSPILAIVQVGDRPDTAAYVRGKKAFAAEIGVEVRHVHLPETASPMSRALSEESGVISQEKIMAEIRKLNVDDHVTGIIVQLPLPTGMDKRAILDAIDPAKDTDGLATSNVQKWSACEKGAIWPATARAVRELLDFYGISLKGKRVCVVGRSELVGAPIAAMCRGEGAEVVVCHSQTVDLKKETLSADIIISVVGKPGLITANHVKRGQIIVDVGINEISISKERLDAKSSDDVSSEALNNRSKRKLVGDVDFNAVQPILGHFGAITPVPGGVGPMTVLALFENLADQCML
jgi:5,10-methylene-tetrahydrofolate dehydrogenase/methenyl tetrahydrofolate cyclohydrolase/retron-type reverse transcriptase